MHDALLDVPVLVLLGILDRLANLRVGEALPDHRRARRRQTPVWCAARKVSQRENRAPRIRPSQTAVPVIKTTILFKVLTGAFAGYFSAIELVIGRTIFGNYCAAASLLGCSESPTVLALRTAKYGRMRLCTSAHFDGQCSVYRKR
jgi:hypothetical protein